ncbi:winged helix-turn-helix domain-containing protein [Vibrio sp. D404a]|uniref:winged helix-turn-helix domain-containing protein n=1 Tax=unclassified Vibrio TaxID=2614977 RepID=UPI002556C912|nr:winged helix-turn-helix domain-containing protein [Vibrio sp. D404a]MDK9799170.1 winged helix-turn-helix domain-containing protein [Vibrio sp. D449a]
MKRQNYQICEATYDPLRRQFHFNDGEVETLSPLEGKVFLFLLQNLGDCVERSVLFNECWGDVIVSEQALTNVVSKLRKTLAKVTCDCATIRTVSKTGYLLEVSSLKPNELDKSDEPSIGTENASQNADFETQSQPTQSQQSEQTPEQSATSSVNPKTVALEEQSRGYLNVGFFVAVALCLAVVVFNLYRTFDSSLPYFVDKSNYKYSQVDGSNHHYLHVVREGRYSIEELKLVLARLLPKPCQLSVFMRIYPSVDSPDDDALSLFILNGSGHSFNYSASIFDPKTSFDSLSEYVVTRDYLCGL